MYTAQCSSRCEDHTYIYMYNKPDTTPPNMDSTWSSPYCGDVAGERDVVGEPLGEVRGECLGDTFGEKDRLFAICLIMT